MSANGCSRSENQYIVLQKILDNRRSCRAFHSSPISRECLSTIFSMAQRTASWCNSQPWDVVCVSGHALENLRQSLMDVVKTKAPSPDIPFPVEYRGVYKERRRECGIQLYESLGISRENKRAAKQQALENFNFFGAPHVAIITTPSELGTYGAIDCGAYASNLMLVAQSLGISAITQAAIANYSDFLKDHLSIDPSRNVVCCVSFGYMDHSHPANKFKTRRECLKKVVEWVD